MQQASGSATQRNITSAPMAVESTFILVADQELRTLGKGSTSGLHGLRGGGIEPRVLLSVNTPEDGKISGWFYWQYFLAVPP